MNDTIPSTVPGPILQAFLYAWGDKGSRYFCIAGIGLIMMPWFGVVLQALLLSNYGIPGPMDLVFLVFALIALSIPGMLITGSLALISKLTRPYATSILITAVFAAASLIAAAIVGGTIRTSAFENIAKRADPLIQAIKKYETDKGYPPTHLNNIVPEYLAEIPGTGVGAYPDYIYTPGDADSSYPWNLAVDVGHGAMNWDELLYLPGEQYPPKDFAVAHEKIGKWIYIQE